MPSRWRTASRSTAPRFLEPPSAPWREGENAPMRRLSRLLPRVPPWVRIATCAGPGAGGFPMASRALFTLFLAALLGVGSCLPLAREAEPEAAAPAPAEAHRPRLLPGVGSHRHPISTKSPEAQRYFDQGLALTYGFNHDGAIDAFREAARLDPECAICWWGIAFAYGPEHQRADGARGGDRRLGGARGGAKPPGRAREPGRARVHRGDPARYAPDPQPAEPRGPRRRLRRRDARRSHAAPPERPRRAALFAESLMDLSPWNYWQDDGSPREVTLEAARRARGGARARPRTTPARSTTRSTSYERFEPQRAEAAADRLVCDAPDAGHLVHMPAHIYYRVGPLQGRGDVNDARRGVRRRLLLLVPAPSRLRRALLHPQPPLPVGRR